MKTISIRKKPFFLFFGSVLCVLMFFWWAALHSKTPTIYHDTAAHNQVMVQNNNRVVKIRVPVLHISTIANRESNTNHSEEQSSYRITSGLDNGKMPKFHGPTSRINLLNNSYSKSSNASDQIELAKNKTLAQLGVLGGEKHGIHPKIVFTKLKWNLSVSFEDIGNVMKDTSFFNKLKPLDINGPLLQSSRNRTTNLSLSMPIKKGYCDCWELYCFCCAQLINKQLHLNIKLCANFTFISKSHEFDLTFSIDENSIHRELISADSPPLLCMGSIPTVADICVHFSNVTYHVDRMSMHKSQLLGCTDFSFNIYNKTVNVIPVDCFQIPGDPNHHPKHEQIILPNFVP